MFCLIAEVLFTSSESGPCSHFRGAGGDSQFQLCGGVESFTGPVQKCIFHLLLLHLTDTPLCATSTNRSLCDTFDVIFSKCTAATSTRYRTCSLPPTWTLRMTNSKARIDWARSQRAKEEPTVPSTIGRWQRRLVDVFLIDMTYGKFGSGWERVLYFTT